MAKNVSVEEVIKIALTGAQIATRLVNLAAQAKKAGKEEVTEVDLQEAMQMADAAEKNLQQAIAEKMLEHSLGQIPVKGDTK